MAINPILRMTLLMLLPVSLCGLALSAEDSAPPSKSVDYKRADTNFYARGDVLKSDPDAVILPATAIAQNGDTYTFTPKKKAPKIIYIEAPSDWIEPITPPDMPASLAIAPDAMQIREPQGDVQVAMPNAPGSFSPVTEGMTLPNGAVVKTGTNATAAILFGGVDSARLMPDSEAAVQQTVLPQSRSVEIDLTAGGVFAKVGTQLDVTSEYQVHTPFGNAIAQAGDFAAVSTSNRTDVWVALGTVELLEPDGKKFGEATGDGTGPLKLIRYPAIDNPAESIQADSESLTTVLNFIPVADQKLAALRAKQARGTPLTANENAYLHRIAQVPALIKLALVAPPAPPPTEVITIPSTPPANAGNMVYASIGHTTGTPVVVHASGTIKFQGTTMGLDEFQTTIAAFATANPDQIIILTSDPKLPDTKLQAVVEACKDAHVHQVVVVPPPAIPPAPPPAPVVPPGPATVDVHADGTIKFQGAMMGLDEFQTEIKAFVAAKPGQAVIVKASPKVDYAKFTAILDACKNASVKELAVAVPAPQPPAPKPLPMTAETPPTPVPNGASATPASPVTAETPPAPPVNNKPVPAEIDLAADGTLTLDGAPITEDDLKTKLADIKQTNPRNPLVMMKQPKVTKDQWMHYVELCHSMGLKLLVKDAKPPAVAEAPSMPATNAAPATPTPPVTAETPPAPAPPVNNKPVPAEIDLAADGSLTLDGAPITEDDLKSKLADIKQTNPKNPLVMMKQSGVTKDQWMHYVDLCHSMGLRLLVKDAKPPAVAETPPAVALVVPSTVLPGPIARGNPRSMNATPEAPAETPPAPAPPVNDKPVPAEIDLAADGTLTLDGAPITEDDLKTKLADIKQTNPKNPLVMMKQPKVTKDQWMHYVDLCHSMGLKLLVKDAKPSAVAEATPSELRPSAAEGGSTEQPPMLAPHLSASPAPEMAPPSPAEQEAVPVEIELTPDGQISFLGEAVSENDLKSRLETVAQTNADEPVVIVKDEKVSHDQWQKIVDLCHAAKLKVKLKTVKSADSGALTPRAPNTVAIATLPPPAAPPAAEKILPVEIDLATEGRLTLEGGTVNVDQLEARLAQVAKAHPNQPILILRTPDVADDSVDALTTLCQGVNPDFKIDVKTVDSFPPPTLPVAPPPISPAENLPLPAVHMHASMDALNGPPSALAPGP